MLTTITKGDTPFQPEDVNYCGERLELLNQHFIKMIEEKKIMSGAYCIAKDGKVITNTAIGRLCYKEEDTREVKPDTIYPLASLTKFITAVAIWQLVEDGKMRVGQAVADFIEEFKAAPFDKITVANLLSHTSGFPGGNKGYHQLDPWECFYKFRDENWISAGLKAGVDCEPNKEWIYSTFNYLLLGEIITRVSGEEAEDYITNHILKPCEMNDTFFSLKKELIDRYNVRTPWNEKDLADLMEEREKSEEDIFWENKKIPKTGFSLYSTTGDVIKFGIMLMQNGWYNGKRVLGRKAIEKMTHCWTKPDLKNYCWGAKGEYRAYGLGPDMQYNDHMLYTEGSYYHEGFGTCCLLIDPIEKLAAVWFAQFEGDQWHAEALFNVSAIMWSGLK